MSNLPPRFSTVLSGVSSNLVTLPKSQQPQTIQHSPRPEPPSFAEFLKHVQIESDPEEGGTGGAIPFKPYDYQVERFEAWQTGQSEIILKPRQIGFSWMVAAWSLWLAGYHEASHVALFSDGEREAKKLMRKVRYIWRRLPDSVRPPGKLGIVEAEFAAGSTITAYPATEDAGIGETLRLAVFDEASFHALLKENVGAVLPALGNFGQCLILSTANPKLGPSGHFHGLFQQALEGKGAYRPVFLPADCRPDRDDGWFVNERTKYAGDPERFNAFYPFTPEDAFVAREGLVFPEFRKELHVIPQHPIAWKDALFRVVGVDPGGSDPTAIVPMSVYRQSGYDFRFHQPYEFHRAGGVTVDSIVNWISVLDSEAPIDCIWIDTAGGTVLMETLRGYFGKDRVFPALKDRDAGLAFYRQVLAEQRLTHHVGCTNTIREYYGYRQKMVRDPHDKTTYAVRTPVDHHADAKDATRYALLGTQQVLMAQAGRGEKKVKLVYR